MLSTFIRQICVRNTCNVLRHVPKFSRAILKERALLQAHVTVPSRFLTSKAFHEKLNRPQQVKDAGKESEEANNIHNKHNKLNIPVTDQISKINTEYKAVENVESISLGTDRIKFVHKVLMFISPDLKPIDCVRIVKDIKFLSKCGLVINFLYISIVAYLFLSFYA